MTSTYKDGVLTITLGDKVCKYAVTDMKPDKRVADRAFRLWKADDTFEDISQDRYGPACTCGSFCFKNYDGIACKHIQAGLAHGLLTTRTK